jgi:hypothetical protein
MRNLKKFGALVIVLALSAIGAASASAAEFTASATGSITAKALENQVFTTNGGTVTCTGLSASGTIESTAATGQHVTVNYSGCTAFGFATVDISAATYTFTADTTVHIYNPITITPTFFGSSMCTVTVPAQTVGPVHYSNAGSNNIRINPTVTGIKYTSTGGSCGSSGENGTYTGDSEASRVGGGTLRFDA